MISAAEAMPGRRRGSGSLIWANARNVATGGHSSKVCSVSGEILCRVAVKCFFGEGVNVNENGIVFGDAAAICFFDFAFHFESGEIWNFRDGGAGAT